MKLAAQTTFAERTRPDTGPDLAGFRAPGGRGMAGWWRKDGHLALPRLRCWSSKRAYSVFFYTAFWLAFAAYLHRGPRVDGHAT